MTFVRREPELNWLRSFLAKAVSGEGQVCFVTGEPGAGKSSLARVFADYAKDEQEDMLVVTGACNSQTGQTDPYMLFLDVLAQLTTSDGQVTGATSLGTLTRVSAEALLQYAPDLIGTLIPGSSAIVKVLTFAATRAGLLDKLHGQLEKSKAAGSLDQNRIVQQYTSLLAALASKHPLLVILDDLHWIDTASCNLFFHLCQRLEGSRLLLVGLYRPHDVAFGRGDGRHPLAPVINELKGHRGEIFLAERAPPRGLQRQRMAAGGGAARGGAMTGTPVSILALGAYVPERVVTNAELSAHLATSDEWIAARTGIRRRHFAADDETTADLAVAAARSALAEAGLAPADVDEIIVTTDTPEVHVPDTAAFVQHRLRAREVPAYDLAGSGCAGFLQGLDVARSRVRCGIGRVLVIGVELLSRVTDLEDRNTAVLFGDGAGAAIVGAGAGAEILEVVCGTDGSRTDILGIEFGGTLHPVTLETARERRHLHITMKGREVFKEAVRRMSGEAQQVLARAGLVDKDIALLVPHQANLRIIQAVGESVGLPMEKIFVNVEEYGNTGSASVPLALWEARRAGRIHTGDLVLLTSFGAGFH